MFFVELQLLHTILQVFTTVIKHKIILFDVLK